MSTTEYRNKHLRRKRKADGPRKRRQKQQRDRLVALGMPEADVAKLNAKEVRTKLKYPKKVATAYAAAE